jgi:hypothetical protein
VNGLASLSKQCALLTRQQTLQDKADAGTVAELEHNNDIFNYLK